MRRDMWGWNAIIKIIFMQMPCKTSMKKASAKRASTADEDFGNKIATNFHAQIRISALKKTTSSHAFLVKHQAFN